MADQNLQRKLAAIVAADIAGYSRLMGSDEIGTLQALKAHRKALIDPMIAAHHGRIVKTTGDGMLVEFASVVDAVTCSVAIQRGMISRNADTPENKRIVLRVGINVGDIIVDSDDIYGDGVNVAARLEALCDPGGLCISRAANDQIRDKLSLAFADLGEQTVKNISRAVGVFGLTGKDIAALPADAVIESSKTAEAALSRRMTVALRRHPAPVFGALAVIALLAGGIWWLNAERVSQPGQMVSPSTAPQQTTPEPAMKSAATPTPPALPVTAAPGSVSTTSAAPRLSIVVLPFINLSSDPEQEYFVDGLTEDLTTDLSRIAGSFVIARNTAFTYKGKSVDMKQIGRDLGVRYVLEGSVQRTGQQVRLNAQLIEAESGTHVWADRFDGDRHNLLEMQNDVTARIAFALRLEIVQADARRVQRQKSLSLGALEHIALGRALLQSTKTAEVTEQAKRHFEIALEQEPQAVEAMTFLGFALLNSVGAGWAIGIERTERLARAEQLLKRALALDLGSADAYAGLGTLYQYQGRLDDSVAAAEQALSLNRNHPGAHRQLAASLMFSGRPDEAIKIAERHLRLSPRDPFNHVSYWVLGLSNLLVGRTDQAIAALKQGRQINSQLYYIHANLAAAFALQGNLDEAKSSLAEFIRLAPQYNTLKKFRSIPGGTDPRFRAFADKTAYRGLLMAGLPEE